MRIHELSLTNYRSFQNLDLTFDPRLTVLVGANGAGKTAILEAISAALGTFLATFDGIAGYHLTPKDARLTRLKPDKPAMTPNFPVKVVARGVWDDTCHDWYRSLESLKGRTTTKDARPLSDYAKTLIQAVHSGKDIKLPILAYYGTSRLWKEGKFIKPKKKAFRESQFVGYRQCMERASSYKEFADWIGQAAMAIAQNKARVEEGIPSDPIAETLETLVRSIQKATNEVLKPVNWSDIFYSHAAQEVTATHPTLGVIPISQLSDGVRNMVSLIMDVAYRCCRLNPDLKEHAATETEGIVMIDELGMHLHPAWQQEVVGRLLKAFPKIQFIVTTHSPQILSTVDSQSIRILEDQKIYQPQQGTKGAQAQRILKSVFGVDPRPQKDENAILLKEYLDLVYQDKWDNDRARKLRLKLNEIFGKFEPDLHRADLHIENRKWELEDEAD